MPPAGRIVVAGPVDRITLQIIATVIKAHAEVCRIVQTERKKCPVVDIGEWKRNKEKTA